MAVWRSACWLYSPPVADFPPALTGSLGEELARIVDVEGKIPAAIDALAPVNGRDVVVIASGSGFHARQLTNLGGRVVALERLDDSANLASESADVVVSLWSDFGGPGPADLGADVAAADRLLRSGGRLVVVHDYGRDDVSRLRGDLPEYGLWTRRDGPFLRGGFRIRVLHCWWTFGSLDEARDFLGRAFGPAGQSLADELHRPRLSYNVALYHRERPASPGGGARVAAYNRGDEP
jgi:hypothetical protein